MFLSTQETFPNSAEAPVEILPWFLRRTPPSHLRSTYNSHKHPVLFPLRRVNRSYFASAEQRVWEPAGNPGNGGERGWREPGSRSRAWAEGLRCRRLRAESPLHSRPTLRLLPAHPQVARTPPRHLALWAPRGALTPGNSASSNRLHVWVHDPRMGRPLDTPVMATKQARLGTKLPRVNLLRGKVPCAQGGGLTAAGASILWQEWKRGSFSSNDIFLEKLKPYTMKRGALR